jgi:hypothetical protein
VCIFIIAAICLKLNLEKYDEDLQSGFACTQYVHLYITRHIARVNRHIFCHNQQQSALFQKWRLLKYLLRRHLYVQFPNPTIFRHALFRVEFVPPAAHSFQKFRSDNFVQGRVYFDWRQAQRVRKVSFEHRNCTGVAAAASAKQKRANENTNPIASGGAGM